MEPSTIKYPTKVVYGDRIGRAGTLRLGCSAVLFGKDHQTVLLTRRSDNGQWCLPGGMIDPGESVAEGCKREVFEETGLRVRVVRLTGVYSNPNRLTIYPDGNKAFVIVLNFEVEQVGGKLGLSDETTEAQFFTTAEAVQMNLFHGHAEHIRDTLIGNYSAAIR
ncbi:MAG: NUDIX domain-containing protein [Anaerolineales bacterium]|jgi:ADP-ribose pyrophosphatase YjhB (NUDIX family)